jgi:hypothetical protein
MAAAITLFSVLIKMYKELHWIVNEFYYLDTLFSPTSVLFVFIGMSFIVPFVSKIYMYI